MSKTDLRSTSIVQRTNDIPCSWLDDELLFIDSQAGYCYSLNKTAGKVLDLISTPTAIDDICTQLLQMYEVEPAICQHEVIALLQHLLDAKLVQVVDGTGA